MLHVFFKISIKEHLNKYCQALKHKLRLKHQCFLFEFYDKKGQEIFFFFEALNLKISMVLQTQTIWYNSINIPVF